MPHTLRLPEMVALCRIPWLKDTLYEGCDEKCVTDLTETHLDFVQYPGHGVIGVHYGNKGIFQMGALWIRCSL